MKRNSDLRNTWSSCTMQMLKRQTRVKGAVSFVIQNMPSFAKKKKKKKKKKSSKDCWVNAFEIENFKPLVIWSGMSLCAT